ncbi:MAG: ABC transporter permease subunit [Ignavibacteriaceae bacterium]|jgi:ABC-type transport system involved in multi-copper enzyme maturation permease subunit
MKNLWILTWYTLREAMARKVFIFFLIISVLVLIVTGLIFSLSSNISLGAAGATPFGNPITMVEMMIVSPLASLCLLLAIFSSSSFVPVMLEKGNIDLLLSKPVSRDQLLWGKYLGGILVVLLNITFLILGVWLIISIKFSFWDFYFLNIILSITFTFAVLYSLIVLFGVITKGSTLGMMIAYFIFIILSPLLFTAKDKFNAFIENKFLKDLIEAFYYIIPKTSELMGKVTVNLASGKAIEDYQPVLTSFAFLILTMGIAISIFRKKDF